MITVDVRRCAFVAVMLTAGLCSLANAQLPSNSNLEREFTSPLTLSGSVAVGGAQVQDNTSEAGGPVATLDADLSGYWQHPRILAFELRPTINFGDRLRSVNIGAEGNGFSSSVTFLGGSRFPLTLSYGRMGTSDLSLDTNQFASGVKTASTSDAFGLNWQLRLDRLPGFRFDYSKAGSNVDLKNALGEDHFSSDSQRYLFGSDYRVWKWDLNGQYRISDLNRDAPGLLTLGGTRLEDTRHQTDLEFDARRRLPFDSNVMLSFDRTNWDYQLDGIGNSSSYDSTRARFSSMPVRRLSLAANATYTSNLLGSRLQQALGDGSTVPAPTVASTFDLVANRALAFGGGAGYQLGHGFAVNGSISFGRGLSDTLPGGQNPTNNDWTAGLSYEHSFLHRVSFTASYSYQQSNTRFSTVQSFASDAHNLAAGVAGDLPAGFHGSASAQLTRSSSADLPGRVIGATFLLERRLVRSWKLSGNVGIGSSTIDFPLHFESRSRSFSLIASSPLLQLSATRTHNSGLALQTGDSLTFISDPQSVLLSPFGSLLSSNRSVQTTFAAYLQPRRGRFFAGGSWSQYSYSTDALSGASTSQLLNVNGGYRFRRLKFVAGFARQSQALDALTMNTYARRQFYVQVVRGFRVF